MPAHTPSPLPPVTPARIAYAAARIGNAETLATISREVDVPYHVACAFVEKESGGRHIWGHDTGGVNYVEPPGTVTVTRENWLRAYAAVMQGAKPNGYSLLQITYGGELHTVTIKGKVYHFRDGGHWTRMLELGMQPWTVRDSLTYALGQIVKPYLDEYGDLALAAGHYNGGTEPDMVYGRDVAARDLAYRKGFGLA